MLETEFHRIDGNASDFLQLIGEQGAGTADRRFDYRITFADTLEI